MAKRIFINLGRCILCRACEVACERIYGEPRIRVFEYLEMMALPINCRHCEKAPCMEVCPTRALYRDADGAVVLNELKCIGCMMCGIVCPFGIPELGEEKIMIKCDMCKIRREKDQLPACVAICPTDALVYGELKELMAERKMLTAEKAIRAVKEAGIPPILV